MTYTIIKRAAKGEGFKHRADCGRCGCEFTFHDADALPRSSWALEGTLEVDCPNCNQSVVHYLRTGIFNGPGSIRQFLEAGAAMVLFVAICVGGYFLGWGLQ